MKNKELRMGKRDLPERTFEFAVRVVKLCKVLEQTPGVSRTLANQLLRSGTSIGANVEEAQAGQSKADFISKLSIACKEARETHYWLRLLSATELVPESRLTELLDEANQLIAILTTVIKKTRRNSELRMENRE
jgi:four helix bundle protein